MAKRNVEYGVIAPENLQEWASAQTAGGTFMLTPRTAKGVPYPLYWRGLLTGDFPGNDRALLIFTDDVMHRASTGSGKWGGPWRKVADCIAPETHQLPLADGWTKFDALLQDPREYCYRQHCRSNNTKFSSVRSVGNIARGFSPGCRSGSTGNLQGFASACDD